MTKTGIIPLVTELLARTPEWVRDDLSAKEPAARARAEETLAAMIAAAIEGEPDNEAAA